MNSIKWKEGEDSSRIPAPDLNGRDIEYVEQEDRPMYGVKSTEKDDNIYLGEITGLPANGFDNND